LREFENSNTSSINAIVILNVVNFVDEPNLALTNLAHLYLCLYALLTGNLGTSGTKLE
jgi:hypothetical protein